MVSHQFDDLDSFKTCATSFFSTLNFVATVIYAIHRYLT
jgi:hypothetical protein